MSRKIVDIPLICPYTGLRSFTEDESLYFKGRDEQIDQIVDQLQERKFLMLTGASGEGKSSLIYAGLIPQARAGFFKARYSNWTVVDFRPERTPVRNLAAAMSSVFSVQQSTLETEMTRGFSSLIDVYQNSGFYIDEQDESWQQCTAAEKKQRLRGASNLLILVDQFEEFFTNPENFRNETPSLDSQIVVNLVLETARLAMQQGLPIYVVCTMRSDYIGQCSAFRGLPEFIGYSQFFVPRLKRNELKQVIEEPAQLSGNRISRRLTERLIYDLAEGVDQLPILQHALSQIWLMASYAAEEMDVIHYAMIGGMSGKELPPADRQRFEEWFASQPSDQQQLYTETGLNKVMEIHATILYERAAGVYNAVDPADQLTVREVKNCIALAFACLTKIDNSRAVRNRMTLAEITAVINKPSITAAKLDNVLAIFRQVQNSFVRPFKTDDVSTHDLPPDTVLDITHESLIRNWGMMNTWANQEYQFHATLQDLRKQLGRWKENGKSSGYLLPIGPLNYFETWYADCKPNAAWINRYMDPAGSPEETLQKSKQLLRDIQEFLSRSARHVAVSRFFLKHGAKKIGLIAGCVVLFFLGGFLIYNSAQKEDSNVIRRVRQEAGPLLASDEVFNDTKAMHLLVEERYEPGKVISHLQTIRDSRTHLDVALATYRQLISVDKRYTGPLKEGLITGIRQDIDTLRMREKESDVLFRDLTNFVIFLSYDNYYNPKQGIDKLVHEEASKLYDFLVTYFSSTEIGPEFTERLNLAIQMWLTFGEASPEKIERLINMITPFGTPDAKATFEHFYPKGSFEANGFRALDYNSGYHTLACLYAALGDTGNVIKCFEQQHSQTDYFTDKLFNTRSNVLGYFYQFGHRDQVPAAVTWIHTTFPGVSTHSVYRDLILRSGYLTPFFRTYFGDRRDQMEEGNISLNLCMVTRTTFGEMIIDYEDELRQENDQVEQNFLLATHFKRIAIFDFLYNSERGLPVSQRYLDDTFDKAWRYFNLIGASDQTKKVTISEWYLRQLQTVEFTRRQLFLYPDYMDGWQCYSFHGDVFLDYIKRKNLITSTYRSAQDLNQLHYWVANGLWPQEFAASEASLQAILDVVKANPAGRTVDMNLVSMVLANNAFQRNDTTKAMAYYNQLNHAALPQSMGRYGTWEKTAFLNEMMQLSGNLAKTDHINETVNLVENVSIIPARIVFYAFDAYKASGHTARASMVLLLDSALAIRDQVDNAQLLWYQEYRVWLTQVLYRVGDAKYEAIGREVFKTLSENRRFPAIAARAAGIVGRGEFYEAYASLPSTMTEQQDLSCRTTILLEAAVRTEKELGKPSWKAMDDWYKFQEFIFFYGFL